MKKLSLGLIAGAALGGAVTWMLTQAPSSRSDVEPESIAPAVVTAGVILSPDQVRAAGITTARPSKARVARPLVGYARVIDLSPLFTLVSELETAETAATASGKELARVRRLNADGENVSARVVETVEASALRDRSVAMSASARLRAGWGDYISGVERRGELIRSLSTGAATLVRVDLATGDLPNRAPVALQLERITGSAAAQPATVLGPAPIADVQFQGVGYFAVVQDQLASGTLLRALIPSGESDTEALLIPATAIARHQGSTLVFVRTGEGNYERRIVTIGQSLKNEVAIVRGLSATDEVAVTGAQQLLSHELLSAPSGS
jgi:multidrug efflux system membrane fusion protein